MFHSLAAVPETAGWCLSYDQNKTDALVNRQKKTEVGLTKAESARAAGRDSAVGNVRVELGRQPMIRIQTLKDWEFK